MKQYRYVLITRPEDEIAMVKAVQEMRIDGIMWPNSVAPQFNLLLTEEELFVLKLKVPVVKCDRA